MSATYVSFYNEISLSNYDGFILDSDNNKKLIYPIAFLFLKENNLINDFSVSRSFEKLINLNYFTDFYSQKSEDKIDLYSFLKGENWILNFSLSEEDFEYINQIGVFFEHICEYRLNETSLNNASSSIRAGVPTELLNKLTAFVLDKIRTERN